MDIAMDIDRQPALDVPAARRCCYCWPFAGVLLLLLTSMLVAVMLGSVAVPHATLWQALWRGLRGETLETLERIIWQIRLPRVLLAASVGAALASSGAVYQGVFRNPLADPYLLGAASGAGLGAALALVLLPRWQHALWGQLGVSALAFVMAWLGVALVVLLARQGPLLPMVSLILAGVVVGSSFSAATSFLMLLDQSRAASVLSWLLGSFALAHWRSVALLLPMVVAVLLISQLAGRALNLLQLGEAAAAQLGLPVERFKLLMISIATLLTATAVSVSGIIGFVGLIVPHAVRLAIGADYRPLVPLAALLGATFMVLADLLARSLIAPAELPVGIITTLVGGPFFLYLLKRQRHKGGL